MKIDSKQISHLLSVARYMIFSMIGIILVQVAIYVLMPPPDTAIGFFELFQENTFKGLLSLDFLYLINNALLIIIYLAFSVFMMKRKPLLAIIAFIVSAIGIACYYASNPIFEFYFISQKYVVATPLEQQMWISVGEGLLVQYIGTAFISYYIFNAIGLFLYAIILLFMKEVPRMVAVFGFMSAIFMSVPSSFGTLGLIFALLSLIPWIVFCLMMSNLFLKPYNSILL